MIVTKTFDEARGAADVPDHPEGKRWPYVVIALDGDTIYADSATEVIEATIADYSSFKVVDENGDSEFFDAGNDLALIARYDDLLRYATAWQETVFAAAIEDGSFDPTNATEDELTALVAERVIPFIGLPLNDDVDDTRVDLEWGCSVPLALMVNDYMPFTERPAPTGNIQWFDPTTELTYLRTLHAIGVLHLLTGE
jgi:hypothetical protein